MTMAVCFKCGVIKFGAFVPCPKCHDCPETEDDLALSLAMTDHYFDMPTLEQIGASVRDGKPPKLDPETHAQLVDTIRSSGMLVKRQGMAKEASKTSESSSTNRPWWKFWKWRRA